MFALTKANLKIMIRNRHTTFWALFFPLMLVTVFGIFQFDNSDSARIAIYEEEPTPISKAITKALSELDFLEFKSIEANELIAIDRLKNGELDYLLSIPAQFSLNKDNENRFNKLHLRVNPNNIGHSLLVEAAIQHSITNSLIPESTGLSAFPLAVERLDVPQPRYFDVVLLGLVGLGIMTNSIISIAVKISTYRNQSILKRLLVTPLPIWKYFASEVIAHLALALVQAVIILGVGIVIFGARLSGNWAGLIIIILLGSAVFLNIGFLMSAWANTPSAASGMGNAIALPMVFFAGTFFSTASLPWILPYLVEALPLTPMLSAMREVSLENASIIEVWPQILTLSGWIIVTGLAAIKFFRFN